MNNKIALIYENKKFRLEVTGEEIKEFKSLNEATSAYEEAIENLNNSEDGKWLDLLESVKGFEELGLVINNEYKNMEIKGLKYFMKTDKVFYIYNDEMIPLNGGFNLFKASMILVKEGKVKSLEDLLLFLREIVLNKTNYRLNEISLLVLGAAFNYGSAEYNFQTGKINKGASIEDFTFEEFKTYVLKIIKK